MDLKRHNISMSDEMWVWCSKSPSASNYLRTLLELHIEAVEAGDPRALDIERACRSEPLPGQANPEVYPVPYEEMVRTIREHMTATEFAERMGVSRKSAGYWTGIGGRKSVPSPENGEKLWQLYQDLESEGEKKSNSVKTERASSSPRARNRQARRGAPLKQVDVDYGALLQAADVNLWGARDKGRVAAEKEEQALEWIRSVVEAYDGSCRALRRDLGWSDAWRQRLQRLYDKGEGTRHISAVLFALDDGLRERAGANWSTGTPTLIRGTGAKAVKARIRWFLNRFYGGMMTAMAERMGFHVSYVHHVLNPDRDENLTDNFVRGVVNAGASARWLYTGQGEPTWKEEGDFGVTTSPDTTGTE